MIQWRSQKFGLRVQPDNFGLKALLILKFCNEKAKTPFYLVHSSLGLGVQMPHCTPSGYATEMIIKITHILDFSMSRMEHSSKNHLSSR